MRPHDNAKLIIHGEKCEWIPDGDFVVMLVGKQSGYIYQCHSMRTAPARDIGDHATATGMYDRDF